MTKNSDYLVHAECPICGSKEIQKRYDASSFRVEGEMFGVYDCKSCSHGFTNPIPREDVIGRYYQTGNYISHTDSKKTLFDRVYQTVKSVSLKRKEQLLLSFGLDKTRLFLDYGAGTGAFVTYLKENNWNTIGIEISEEARKQSANKELLYGLDKLDSIKPNSLSGFSMWHVLEHIYEPKKLLETLRSKTSSEGTGFIAVPNNDSWDAHYYGPNWAALDLPLHFSHFTKASMHKLLTESGFKVVKEVTMPFDAFYISMLSEENKNSTLGKVQGAFKGLYSNLARGKGKGTSSLIFVVKKVEI